MMIKTDFNQKSKTTYHVTYLFASISEVMIDSDRGGKINGF